MKPKVISVLVASADVLAFTIFFLQIPLPLRVVLGVSLHVIAAAFTVLWVKKHLPSSFLRRKRFSFSLLSLLTLFLPLIGMVELLFWGEKSLQMLTQKKTLPINQIKVPTYEQEMHFESTKYGEGGAYSKLKVKPTKITEKIDALLAINSIPGKRKGKIIRDTLYDEEDELRLLAFSLLDAKEKEISKEIFALRHQVQKKPNSRANGPFYKKLALLSWELAYHELSQADMLNYNLTAAYQYAQKALKLEKQDPSLYLLIAKIKLAQHDFLEAMDALQKAQSLNVPPSKTVPYLAEIYFHQRNWKKLREILTLHPELVDIANFSAIVKFWCPTC